MNTDGRAESIRDQLRTLARVRDQDFNALLTLYGLERFLYRLGMSKVSSHFSLKGGMLFNVWYEIPVRLTRDIASGDSATVTKSPTKYSTILDDMPAPELMTYSIYSVIAEKFETIVKRGIVNSRLKDYFDLWFFSSHEILDGHELQRAIANTFARRKTALPDGNPVGLTTEFFNDDKMKSWIAFLSTNELVAPSLRDVAEFIQELTLPVTSSLITGKPFIDRWDCRHWES